ncbi:hypothetical protein DN069_38390 [Streptacidiphilus pinicola]|uniref:Uncharacterized protein n=2 Tax=Streptacidiphilus pinicola TaxID=2219663 RepID=A0A2X0I6Z8_9ACTN|nr:hypothetical protein DN069_38390 [Streptacidiphilus pinicola]
MSSTVLVVVASIDIADGPVLLGWLLTAVFFALLAWDLAPLLRARERGTQREDGRATGRETEQKR